MALLAFDLGGTSLRAALFDYSGHEIAYWKQETKDFKNAQEAFWAALDFFNGRLIEKVAVGAPDIDVESSDVRAHNLPWPHFNLRHILSAKLAVPLFFYNDADLQALALAYEHQAEAPNAIVFTLGTGVGFGVIHAGKIMSSPLGLEGGHLYVGGERVCLCGGVGHLEGHAGAAAILERAGQLGHATNGVRPLVELARAGNQDLQNLFLEVGEKLGIAIASVVSILGIGHIILSGGVTSALDLFLAHTTSTAKHYVFPPFKDKIVITRGELPSDRVGLIGAYRALISQS